MWEFFCTFAPNLIFHSHYFDVLLDECRKTAKPQVKHLLTICPNAHEKVFDGMNHGQLLVDHLDEVAKRINVISMSPIN